MQFFQRHATIIQMWSIATKKLWNYVVLLAALSVMSVAACAQNNTTSAGCSAGVDPATLGINPAPPTSTPNADASSTPPPGSTASAGSGGTGVNETITTNNNIWLNYNDYQSGLYAASNQWWGSGNPNARFTVNPATFPNGVTFSWNWPAVTSYPWNPIAYPNITTVYGYVGSPGGTGQLYSNLVSMPVSAISTLTATYNVTPSDLADTDVAFDFWLLNPSTPDPNWTTTFAETEIEIFVHTPPSWGTLGPVNEPNITVEGLTNATVSNTTTRGPANESGSWQYVSVQSPQDALCGTIDIGAILKQLIAEGVISGNETISDISFGSEVGGGSGSLTVNSYSVNWTQ